MIQIPSSALKLLFSAILFTGFVLSTPIAAQDETPQKEAPQVEDATQEKLFSQETLKAELKNLYDGLKSAHYGLYAHRPKDEYDRYFQETLASIDRPLNRLDTTKLLMTFVAYGKIGHARIDFPIPSYVEYLQGGGTLIPLDIRVEDGRVLIAHNYSDKDELAPGSELIAINGKSIDHWLKRTSRYVSAERPYMVHAQLESMFPRILWLDAGQIDTFQITVRPGSGKTEAREKEVQATVDAVPVMTLEEAKGKRESVAHSRTGEILPGGIAYLRPGPFFAQTEEESEATMETFLDEAFGRFLKAGATDLIVDMRNNPGGNNSYSDPMIAWTADKPFRFASRFVLKTSPETLKVLEGLAVQYPGGLSADMLTAMKDKKTGEKFDFEIPEIQPRKERFTGRVWVLVNRHSYSNATTTAAIYKDYGLATIVGEETADVATTYASSAKFTLPETGIVVTYSKAYFIRPSGDETLSGVVPHHHFETPIVSDQEDPDQEDPDQEDPLLQDVLNFIRAQRPDSEASAK